jgi:hypothetical protein
MLINKQLLSVCLSRGQVWLVDESQSALGLVSSFDSTWQFAAITPLPLLNSGRQYYYLTPDTSGLIAKRLVQFQGLPKLPESGYFLSLYYLMLAAPEFRRKLQFGVGDCRTYTCTLLADGETR